MAREVRLKIFSASTNIQYRKETTTQLKGDTYAPRKATVTTAPLLNTTAIIYDDNKMNCY